MMKEGKQFDDNLTVTKLTSIFASINSAAEEEEDGDDDEQELVFDEFVLVIACICDTKVPAEARGDTAFEHYGYTAIVVPCGRVGAVIAAEYCRCLTVELGH